MGGKIVALSGEDSSLELVPRSVFDRGSSRSVVVRKFFCSCLFCGDAGLSAFSSAFLVDGFSARVCGASVLGVFAFSSCTAWVCGMRRSGNLGRGAACLCLSAASGTGSGICAVDGGSVDGSMPGSSASGGSGALRCAYD